MEPSPHIPAKNATILEALATWKQTILLKDKWQEESDIWKNRGCIGKPEKTSIVLVEFPAAANSTTSSESYTMSLVSPFFGDSFLSEMPLLKFMTVPLPWVLTNVHAVGGGGPTFLGGGCVGQRHEIIYSRNPWGVRKAKFHHDNRP